MKIFSNSVSLLKGLLTDFWMLPLAIILALWHQNIVASLNIFPTLNPEKIGNIVPTIVVWLLMMFFVRLYFFAQYPDIYKLSLMKTRKGNKGINEKTTWDELPLSQRFWCSRIERWVQVISFAMIYSAMM